MTTQEDYWWLVYGDFRPGTGDLPHFGTVVSKTWPLRFDSLQGFANAYGCTVRYARMLGSDNNVNHPKDPNKRKLLADVLKVSPLLFGLPFTSEAGNHTVIEFIGQQHMMAYDDVLRMAWQLFYTGNFQEATKNVALWLYMLENEASEATGVGKIQLLSYQTKFLQLSATSLRDRGALNAALKDSKKAVVIAREVGNPELLVSSLHYLFRIHAARGEEEKALIDIKEALRIVDAGNTSDILKGTIYVEAGEAYAAISKGDKSVEQISMRYLDKAAHIAHTLSSLNDSTHIQFSLSRAMNERAANAAIFGLKREAIDSLKVAHKTLAANNIRWQIDHLLSSADIRIYMEEDATGGYTDILQAINLHEAVNSKNSGWWMQKLHQKARLIDPSNPFAPTVEQKLLAYK